MKIEERLRAIVSLRATVEARFVQEQSELILIVACLRRLGKKIVQTSGVFDLLHSGHAKYLEKAKALGDVLIVGVDADDWVIKRKGPDRPIRSFGERVELLAHFRHVDILTPQFGNLHEYVCPDILVVSESTAEMTEELMRKMRRHCGQLVCLPPQAEVHTTSMIAQLNGAG